MNSSREYQEWTLAKLHDECRDQRSRSRQKNGQQNPLICFELFRRAFVNKDDHALTLIYRMYLPQVAAWVKQLAQDETLDYPLGFYVVDCASNFILKMQKIPFHNFEKLEQIMAYWKKCAFSLMMDTFRKKRIIQISLDELPLWATNSNFSSQMVVEWMIQRIEAKCQSEKERLLLNLAMQQDLKPREIAALYPQFWPSSGAVSTALFRIKAKLKEDQELRSLI